MEMSHTTTETAALVMHRSIHYYVCFILARAVSFAHYLLDLTEDNHALVNQWQQSNEQRFAFIVCQQERFTCKLWSHSWQVCFVQWSNQVDLTEGRPQCQRVPSHSDPDAGLDLDLYHLGDGRQIYGCCLNSCKRWNRTDCFKIADNNYILFMRRIWSWISGFTCVLSLDLDGVK